MVRSRCNLPGSERIRHRHKRAERFHMDRVLGACPCARIREVWRVSSIWIEFLGLVLAPGFAKRNRPGSEKLDPAPDSFCGLTASWAWPVTRAIHTNARRDAAMRGPRPVTGTHRTPRAAYEPPFRPPAAGCDLWLPVGGLAGGREGGGPEPTGGGGRETRLREGGTHWRWRRRRRNLSGQVSSFLLNP